MPDRAPSTSFAGTAAVTVIIAAYNAAGTIQRAIRSALNEPEVAEVVVVDDASTDDTAALARHADNGTGRLKVIMQPRNAGPAAARNRAIEASRAPWICALDADDFFLKGRFKHLAPLMNQADMIADDFYQVDENNIDGERQRFFGDRIKNTKAISFVEFVDSNITRHGRQRRELGFIKPLMRREFLQSHGVTYNENLRLGEDFELYARLLGLGARLLLVPQPGYIAVTRAHSLSGRHSIEDLRDLYDCHDGLNKLSDLTTRDRQALRRHRARIDCRLQWRLLIEAVKQRDTKAALACFKRPMPVPVYLLRQLAGQFFLRLAARLRGAA